MKEGQGAALSRHGYQAMVLDMQGKGEEPRALTAKMSESDQEKMLLATAAMLVKCAVPAK